MRACVGIDPGQTGAMAIIWPNTVGGHKVELFDYNRQIWQALPSNDTDIFVAIESVHAMPQQGVTSTFNFGKNFGCWLGMLDIIYGDNYTFVTPMAWKKFYGLKGKDKEASRLLAIKLFPESEKELHLKKHHNRADALLIANYMKEK